MSPHRTSGSYRCVEIIKRNKRKLAEVSRSNRRTGVPSPPRLIIRRSVINHETSPSRTLQPRLSEPLALSALSGRLDLVVLFSRVLFPVMGALSRRLRLIYSFLHHPPPTPSFIWALYWTPQNGVSPGPCLVVCGSHCRGESEMGEEEVAEEGTGGGVGI